MGRKLSGAVIVLAVLAAACSGERPREYELRGVVVAVDATRQEITIKHDDIPRFVRRSTVRVDYAISANRRTRAAASACLHKSRSR